MRPTERQLSPVLRLRLIGQVAAEDASGRAVLPRTRKSRAILAILALSIGKPVLRLQLVELLWSHREKEQARASLRQALHELIDALGVCAEQLVVERHHITLRPEAVSTDIRVAIEQGADLSTYPGILKGILLEDLSGLDPALDVWLDHQRARLQHLVVAIGESHLAGQETPASRLAAAERLLQVNRSHEGAWRAAMRAHVEAGNRAGALSVYDQCRSALAEHTQTAPSPETTELADRIRQDGETTRSAAVPLFPWAVSLNKRQDEQSARTTLRLGVPPLRVIGGGGLEDLSLGLAEEITTALTRCRWITCVSGASMAAITGLVGADTTFAGVAIDFVLDGSIQRAEDRIRIMVRLLDMRASGAVVWACRFDRQTSDTLGLQDEIGAAIVARVDPELLIHECERVVARRPVDPTPHDLVLQSVPAIYRLERGGFHAAGQALEAAVAADTNHAIAHAWYAYWHLFLVGQGWAKKPGEAVERAADLAERAVTLDPTDARALTLAGHVRGFLEKRPREAIELHDRALRLNPNLALAWCFSGLACSYLGDHDQAARRMMRATELSPSDPHLFMFDTALIMPHMLRADYHEAVEVGRRALELNPWFSSAYKGYLAALGHLGMTRRAIEVRDRLLSLEPGFTVHSAIERSPMTRPEDIERYADGLRLGGLPEGGPAIRHPPVAVPEREFSAQVAH